MQKQYIRFKIKALPKDFTVEEIVDLPFARRGDFCVYRLEKSGWNTVGILLKLAKELKIPYKNFSYGGKKDRHAFTIQYVTIKKTNFGEIRGTDYSLKFCGFLKKPMAPNFILGNKFYIAIRDLTNDKLSYALRQTADISSDGYPNYFDDQRFSRLDAQEGFFACKVLKGHFSGALKIHLTALNAGDMKIDKERKRFFWDNWGNWGLCLAKAKTNLEKHAFSYLLQRPKGFLFLLQEIDREKLSIYFNAYQAYIWNEVLRGVIKEKVSSSLLSYPGISGEYVFYRTLNNGQGRYLWDLNIPTLSGKMIIRDELCTAIYSQLMQRQGIDKPMFNCIKIRKVYFKSIQRRAFVKPENFSYNVLDDEVYPNRKKLVLKFILPRGSYGTMLIKRLFSRMQDDQVS
jgi:tRNA pseudouridine13 synthase